MKLVVVLPALNEEPTVSDVISRIPHVGSPFDQQAVIVVDDGSSDGTATAATGAGATVVRHGTNRGLGVAFQTGIDAALRAGADVVVTIDADGQFDPADVPALLIPIGTDQADVVTASRFVDPAMTPAMPGVKHWGNTWVATIVSFLSGQKISDVACGFRAYRREALLHLNLFSRFSYTQESLMNLIFKGFRVVEVPVRVRGQRQHGRSNISGNLWRYAFHTGNTIFRTVIDYRPMRVFGWLGLALFGLGVLAELFVLIHYLGTGMVTPYKTVGFAGGLLNLLGLLVGMIGIIADMLNRIRMTEERTLTMAKRQRYGDDARHIDRPAGIR